jgi:hypothetical protein
MRQWIALGIILSLSTSAQSPRDHTSPASGSAWRVRRVFPTESGSKGEEKRPKAYSEVDCAMAMPLPADLAKLPPAELDAKLPDYHARVGKTGFIIPIQGDPEKILEPGDVLVTFDSNAASRASNEHRVWDQIMHGAWHGALVGGTKEKPVIIESPTGYMGGFKGRHYHILRLRPYPREVTTPEELEKWKRDPALNKKLEEWTITRKQLLETIVKNGDVFYRSGYDNRLYDAVRKTEISIPAERKALQEQLEKARESKGCLTNPPKMYCSELPATVFNLSGVDSVCGVNVADLFDMIDTRTVPDFQGKYPNRSEAELRKLAVIELVHNENILVTALGIPQADASAFLKQTPLHWVDHWESAPKSVRSNVGVQTLLQLVSLSPEMRRQLLGTAMTDMLTASVYQGAPVSPGCLLRFAQSPKGDLAYVGSYVGPCPTAHSAPAVANQNIAPPTEQEMMEALLTQLQEGPVTSAPARDLAIGISGATGLTGPEKLRLLRHLRGHSQLGDPAIGYLQTLVGGLNQGQTLEQAAKAFVTSPAQAKQKGDFLNLWRGHALYAGLKEAVPAGERAKVEAEQEKHRMEAIFKARARERGFTEAQFASLTPESFDFVHFEMPEEGRRVTLGSPETELDRGRNEASQEVVLNRPFALGKTEVTQAIWFLVMGDNPSSSKEGEGAITVNGVRMRPNAPVETVSWNDISGPGGFLEKLEALDPQHDYALPSEAHWEFAARGGTTSPWSHGEAEAGLKAAGWYQANSNRTQGVARLNPNPFELYDMHGNVWEWTSNSPLPGRDPITREMFSRRVFRGGSWDTVARFLRSAYRIDEGTERPIYSVGFRVERTQK